jgi:hypothetical protein
MYTVLIQEDEERDGDAMLFQHDHSSPEAAARFALEWAISNRGYGRKGVIHVFPGAITVPTGRPLTSFRIENDGTSLVPILGAG